MLKTTVKVKKPDKIVENHTVLNGTEALPYALQKRLEALQYLKSFEGKVEYRKKQTEVAEELGISLRSFSVPDKKLEVVGRTRFDGSY
jgi:hypothetical protein